MKIAVQVLGFASVLLMWSTFTPAAEHEVLVQDFSFQPTQLEIQAGDTVTWRATQGGHNVVADNGSFTSGPPRTAPWTFSHTFHDEGEFGYFCAPHGGAGGVGMAGRIVVLAASAPPAFRINDGLNGIWHNPATPGQGWFFDVAPELNQLFFAAWFTWTNEAGRHDWFTAQGSYEGDRAIVPLVRTHGGRFDANDPVTFEAAGEAEFVFESCSRAELRYRVDETGDEGVIPLERLTPAPERCEAAQEDE